MRKIFTCITMMLLQFAVFYPSDAAGTAKPAQPHEALTIEAIWGQYAFLQRMPNNFYFMKDGQHYTTIEQSKDGSQYILMHELRTGRIVDTVFFSTWLQIENSNKLLDCDSYQFSPDETKILIATDTEPIYRHSTVSTYYIWDRTHRRLIPLYEKAKQQEPQFSPDGTKIGFVSNNNLFYRDLTQNSVIQVTYDGKRNEIINGITDWVYEEEFSFTRAFTWSTDSRKLAFYRFDEMHVPEFSMDIYNSLYPEKYTFKYPKAGEKNATVHILIYNLDTRKTIIVDTGNESDQYIARIKWTAHPNILSIQRLNRHQNKLDLLFVDALTGKSWIVYTETSDTYIEITDDLYFLQDQSGFLLTSERNKYRHLYFIPIDYTQYTFAHLNKQPNSVATPVTPPLPQPITSGEWDVTAFYGIDEKNSIIYYQSAEVSPLQRQVYAISINSSQKKRLSQKKGTYDAVFHPNFTYCIFYHSDANTPLTVSLHDSEGTLIRLLEENAGLKDKLKALQLTPKEFFSFTTEEGITLYGWMIKPPSFNPRKKYPVLLYVYGGPGSQTVTDSWGGQNQMWFHLLAARGYIVASVDNRGTGARGTDFKKMTYLQLGKYETIDQIAAARYLASQRYVDGNRIGIFGWSYGGYIASLCITKGAEVFKLAIAVAPVTHWKFYDTIYTERYMRTPQENPDGYEENAPINYADRLRGKYLLIHGTADDNVHFQNTVEMTKALIAANKQFDIFFYPNSDHSIRGSNTRWHLYNLMTEYILNNL